MLYPTLEDGHEVLGQEYCSGYTDTFGKWNTGFYCPLIIPDVPVFCCGSLVLKYCCTLGKPIPGGHYSKGYDNKHEIQVEDGQDDLEEEDEQAENEGTERHGVVVTVPQVGGDSVAGGTQTVDDQFFNQNSLVIGAICGLVALAALITIVMCFYCSCCVLYKKRRGRRLHEGGLLYGIPVVSSSQTTTCGLLGNLTRGSGGGGVGVSTVVTEQANACQSNSSSNTTTLPNFITTTTPSLNPLVDYWTTTSNSSPSCRGVGGCGGASNTVIVAATASSLSPANIVGGHGGPPHHHIHGSVYHHHHHYTADFGIGASRPSPSQAAVPPPSALEPPPPYGLAVAGPAPTSLITNCCETATVSSNSCAARTPRRTGSRDSNNSTNSNTNYLIQRQLSLIHANNNVSSTTSPATACNNGNSPNSSTCTTAASLTNSTATSSNALSRLLSSATGGGGPSRGSLPPPYFVEQYRIRNRARPPPFPTNSSRNTSDRSRTQETLHNLLYPLLNSTSLGTTGTTGRSNSSSSGGGRSSRRRVAVAGGDQPRNTQATDTQSEPRRRAHNNNHNQNRNCVNRNESGRRLHRSSSDRQQTCESSLLGAVGDDDLGRCPYTSGHSQEEGEAVVVVMNNVINNLSGTRARGGGSRINNGATRHEGNDQVVGGDERGRSDSCGVIVGSDSVVKILNTQHVQGLQGRQELGGSWGEGERRRDRNREMNCIPMRRLPSATHHHQNSQNNQFTQNREERNVFGNDLRVRGSDSDRGSNEGDVMARRRRMEAADDDDIIMMTEDDDDEEMIAVVTTTTTSTTRVAEQEDEEDDDQVDIIDNLVVMGCFGSSNERNDCEEDYLVGEEEDNDNSETEENSMGKSLESEVNSLRMSASHSLTRLTTTSRKAELDEPSSEDEQQNTNDNGKETRNETTMNINNNNDDNDNSDISGCSVSVSTARTGTREGNLDRQLVMTVVAKKES